MKREDLKELAIKARFDVAGVQGFLLATGLEGTQDHKLRKLISLIEKATLERAAKVCDEQAERFDRASPFNGKANYASIECAKSIRALKTQ